MTDPDPNDPNLAFYEKVERAFRDLFDRARAANEIHFAFALFPEFRGMQDAGWSTAHEAIVAFDEFIELLDAIDVKQNIRGRLMLAFYAHVSEGAGFYEIPKKLLLTIEGKGNNTWPFQNLVERHRITGETIAPNANRILRNLVGHATELGLTELAEVFRDAFDPDIRNAIAHADYILWSDGLRLPHRNGGPARVIPYPEFNAAFHRGINLFGILREITNDYVASYDPPKIVRGRLHQEPPGDWTIYANPKTKQFGIKSGKHPNG